MNVLKTLAVVGVCIVASTALAGTELELKNRFHVEATNYRQTFNDFMKEKTGMNVGGRMIMWKQSDEEEEEPEQIDTAEIPAFEYRSASLADSLTAALPDLGILTLFNLLFFLGAFVAFVRYDLR